ncbi:MAG TPA: formylglycine-generating enzyme family protein [Pirellulales bacterium]|nr:formylglycine-generating enzyme family protein [Pirellulales bacterium]
MIARVTGNLRRPRFLFQVFAAVLTLCASANSYAVEPAASGQGKAALPPLAKFPLSAEEAQRSQAEWAAALKVAPTITNSLNIKLTLIPPGRFSMGPNGSTYRVTINKPFYLGTTEVTLEAYRHFKPGHEIEGAAPEFNAGDRPAAMATWNDAVAFCRWLSERPAERAAGRNYRLPSEAQWEWAARAGTATVRYFGDKDQVQREYFWFNHTYTQNPKQETGGRGRQAVAQLKPNAWGLYDMLGNVWEWCSDRRSNEETGEVWQPVMRGGSWRSGGFHCTAVAHDPADPNVKGDHIGFRVVCTLKDFPSPSGN